MFCQIIPQNKKHLKYCDTKLIFLCSSRLLKFCGVSFFCEIITPHIFVKLLFRTFFYEIIIPHDNGFCTLFVAPLLHTAHWYKSPNFEKGVLFLLTYCHNFMNPQTESRAKKRGEKREDRAREKEVTSAKLSLSQTYHHPNHHHFKSSWSTTSGAATSEGGGRGRAV